MMDTRRKLRRWFHPGQAPNPDAPIQKSLPDPLCASGLYRDVRSNDSSAEMEGIPFRLALVPADVSDREVAEWMLAHEVGLRISVF